MRNLTLIVFSLALIVVPVVGEQRTIAEELLTAADFQRHVEYLASDELAGRAPATEGSAQAAQYIIDQFQQAGLTPLLPKDSWLQDFSLDKADPKTGAMFGKNVIGVHRGKGPLTEQAIVVAAHYDHLNPRSRSEGGDAIFNGADDNASGVAALILIAQALHADAASLGDNYRTVIFISFDAEESGLLGAKRYVQRPPWPLAQTTAMINFDGVGRMRLGKFFVFDVETSPVLAQSVRDAAQRRKLIAETRLGSHGRSDHAEFVAHGIPSMHFFTGTHADYHKVTDEADRVNHEGGAAVAAIAYDVLRQAIVYPGALEFKPLNPVYDIKLILRVMTSLGIVPNVAAQNGRYPEILMVTPGSPAARYGLESGDQITAIDGVRLERVEDALSLFQQATLAAGMRLTVQRESGEREIELPAEIFSPLTGPKATPLGDGNYEVQFKYQADPQVKAVYLAGEFNDWKPTALAMDGPDDTGLFTTRLKLAQGVYQYKFVLDGTEWLTDPANINQTGAYNNSVVWVGEISK